MIRIIKGMAALAAGLVVAACGGGDDESAGSLTAFSLVPSDLTLKGPNATTCGTGYAGRIYVYGGAGPYRLDNTAPDAVVLTHPSPDGTTDQLTTTVSGPGDFFDVQFTGACLDPMSVVVVDQTGRQVILTLHSVKGE